MRILTWLFFATLSLVLMLQLRGFESDLRTPDTPHGMTGFELAWSAPRASITVDTWQRAGVTETAKVSLGIGFVFIIAYSLLLAKTIGLLRRAPHADDSTNRPHHAFYATGQALGQAVLVAIPFGIAENLMLWRMLSSGVTPGLAHLATACAIIKFVLVLLAGTWSLMALGARLVSRFAPAAPRPH